MKRPTPLVAARNKATAHENIIAKLETMQRAASLEGVQGKLPSSLRQFNRWAPAKDSIAPGLPSRDLTSNAPQTLRVDVALTRATHDAIAAGTTCSQEEKISRRESRLTTYRDRLRLSESLRSIAEARLCDALHELEQERQDGRKIAAQLASVQSRLRTEVEVLEGSLAAERERVAELTKTLRKTTRLSRT